MKRKATALSHIENERAQHTSSRAAQIKDFTMNDNMLRNDTPTTFAGKEITLKELTVAQVRKIIIQLENDNTPQLIDDLLDCNIPAIAIAEASGISVTELENSNPSELKALAEEVEQINFFFAEMIKRKVKAFDEINQALNKAKELSPITLTTTPVN